jgi:hypothetical protein
MVEQILCLDFGLLVTAEKQVETREIFEYVLC